MASKRQRTVVEVNIERQEKDLPLRKVCPHCGIGAAEVTAHAGDDEIYERSYQCTWCGQEWGDTRNPYDEKPRQNNIDRYEKIESAADRRPYEHSPNEPCPECGGWVCVFTGFEMYEDNPIAKNYHCEECDTWYSEGYP